jgi:hypothetical protein
MTTRLATFPVKHPSAALLFVQILGILLYPLMGDRSAERVLFGVIGVLVLGAALYVVKRGPWLTGSPSYSHFPWLPYLSAWRSISIPAEWSSWPVSRRCSISTRRAA